MKKLILLAPFLILALWGCATGGNPATGRSPSSSVTPAQVTQAYTSVLTAIRALNPKTIDCGPGYISSEICYQGNSGCRVKIGYVPTGMFTVFVDAAHRPPYPSQCDMTLISPSHTIEKLVTRNTPYVMVNAVTTTTPDQDDGPKSVDPCSIKVQEKIVTVTTKEGSTSCELGE